MRLSCGTHYSDARKEEFDDLALIYKKVWWHRRLHGDTLIFIVVSCPTNLLGKHEYLNNRDTSKGLHTQTMEQVQVSLLLEEMSIKQHRQCNRSGNSTFLVLKNIQSRWKDVTSSSIIAHHLLPCHSSCRSEEEEVKSKAPQSPEKLCQDIAVLNSGAAAAHPAVPGAEQRGSASHRGPDHHSLEVTGKWQAIPVNPDGQRLLPQAPFLSLHAQCLQTFPEPMLL